MAVDDTVLAAPPNPVLPPTVVVNGNGTITVTLPPRPAGINSYNVYVDGTQVNVSPVLGTTYTTTGTYTATPHRVTYTNVV